MLEIWQNTQDEKRKEWFLRFAILSNVAFRFVIGKCSTCKFRLWNWKVNAYSTSWIIYFFKIESLHFPFSKYGKYFFLDNLFEQFLITYLMWNQPYLNKPIFCNAANAVENPNSLSLDGEVGFWAQFLHRFSPLVKRLA